MVNNFQEKVSFIWSVADLLRGDYKQSEHGKVILPLTVLRRLDCVLEPTKEKVLAKAKTLPKKADETNLLYLVISKFTEIDLHPDAVDNIEMGYIFEELIRLWRSSTPLGGWF